MSRSPTPDAKAARDRARFEPRLDRWATRPGRWRTPHSQAPPVVRDADLQARLAWVRQARAARLAGHHLPPHPHVVRARRRALRWMGVGLVSLLVALWP